MKHHKTRAMALGAICASFWWVAILNPETGCGIMFFFALLLSVPVVYVIMIDTIP